MKKILGVIILASLALVGCKEENKGYASCVVSYENGDKSTNVYSNGDLSMVFYSSEDNKHHSDLIKNVHMYKDAKDFVVQESKAYIDNSYGATAICQISEE